MKFKRTPLCLDVFGWPEFQALIKRLGIPHAKTKSLVIRLMEPDLPVVIEHEFLGEDTQQQDEVQPTTATVES